MNRSREINGFAATIMIVVTMIGWAGNANAQQTTQATENRPARVSANVSKSVVQVAEPFQLELVVVAATGTNVFFPAVGNQLGDFDVVEHQDIFDIPVKTGSSGDRSWTRRVTLESIQTGDLEIPSIEIKVTGQGTATAIKTRILPMRVLSVLEDRADPTQFRDILSVVDVSVPQPKSRTWVWWTVGGMGAFALAVIAIALVARRKKFLTPKQWAIGELDKLAGTIAMRKPDAETALREMSSILREYLDLQFEISAPVQTTEEFLHLVERGQFVDAETVQLFAGLLMQADQAKFAGLQLPQTGLQQAIDNARSLVEKTATAAAPGTKSPKAGISSQSTDVTETR